ncbi:MAG: hypothetical protein ABMA02_12995, partial [Saprospiraceae bacterium]
NFRHNHPAMAANFALPETKFARFRLGTEFYTRSKTRPFWPITVPRARPITQSLNHSITQ